MTSAATWGHPKRSARSRAARPCARARRVERERTQRLGQRDRVAGGDEDAVGGRRGRRRDNRGCRRRPRASRRRTPPSGPCRSSRRGARARRPRRRAASSASLRSSETLPSASTPRSSSIMWATSPALAPTRVRVASTCSRSASNARSSTGRPLRSTAWPTNRIRSGAASGAAGREGGSIERRARLTGVDAVGNDPVAPAVEAPGCPRGGLRDGDADVQAVHPPPAAEADGGDAVREEVLGVGVEGSHQRQLAEVQRASQPREGHHGLVDVHDVVAPTPELAA